MLTSVSINWVAIVLAGVINMVIGMLWWSPMMFGGSMKSSDGKAMRPDPMNMVLMFIIAMVIAFIFTYFVVWAGANTFGLGLEVGVLAAIAFFVLPMASGTLAMSKDWRGWGISSGYWIVALAIMGGLLAAMR